MPARAATVGIFDSGIGGLAVVKELIGLEAPFDIWYLADHGNAPYGIHHLDRIRGWAEEIVEFFAGKGIGLVVIACNSASAAALYALREKYPAMQFVGMEPAVKPATERSRKRRIGVIATAATLAGEPFRRVVERYASGHIVVHRACPELVTLVENGALDGPESLAVVARCLGPVLAEDIDQLVLGCTHFSFLIKQMLDVVGDGVEIIDPCRAVARQAIRVADSAIAGSRDGGNSPRITLLTTGVPRHLAAQSLALLACRLSPIAVAPVPSDSVS